MEPLLRVSGLKKHFSLQGGFFSVSGDRVLAVDGIDLDARRGETLGLVGESGCGKTTAAKTIIRAMEPTAGSVTFEGVDVLGLNARQMRRLRRRMQLVYQDPYSSLNPRIKIGRMIAEGIKVHGLAAGREVKEKVASILEKVGLHPDSMNRYPHEFSGGQRQRIGIARSLVLNPDMMILDEPISALDVSIQAQVINLLAGLQKELGLSYIIIAHDLSLMKHICDRLAVMYLGKIVEEAFCKDLYASPAHPYTRALLAATPIPDPRARRKRAILSGDVPSPLNPPAGCRFHTRCGMARGDCRQVEPSLRDLGEGHRVACHLL